MRFSSTLLLTLISVSASVSVFASNIHSTKPCNAHTWHQVSAAEGNWKVSLQVINEADHAGFVGSTCEKINSVNVPANNPQHFGFLFDENVDFDLAYTVTATEQSSAKGFSSKACVFVVTAKAPAQPDIMVNSYHGAKCDWKAVPGVGEDFYVG